MQKTEMRADTLSVDELCEATVVRLTTENDEKIISFLGYGYYSEDSSENPYRFVDYSDFEVPLSEAMPDIRKYESDEAGKYKQYIDDCSEQDMRKAYLEYDNGNMPALIDVKDISETTPDGCYIVLNWADDIEKIRAAVAAVTAEIERTPVDGVRPVQGSDNAVRVGFSVVARSNGLIMSPRYYIPKEQAKAVREYIGKCRTIEEAASAVRHMVNEGKARNGDSDIPLNETTLRLLRSSELVSII